MIETKQPRIVHDVADLRRAVQEARAAGRSIGLVPTMGALHPGHVSLVDESARTCGFTIVTIFVNPTQFGPKEDFSKYPRTLEADVALVSAHGADLIFAPATEVVYPPGHATFVEMHGITEPLEGECRPGHFRGVATVVLKLFNMAAPDVAFFGRKDFQQTLVIKQLVRDFDLPIEIRVCPTLREADGLAMSSRNIYLSNEERQQALSLSRALRKAEQIAKAGERDVWKIRDVLQTELAATPAIRVQYAVVADAETLREPATLDRPCVALIAAFVGKTRLIDNCLFEPSA
ncbi:MAG: pantoate--beta-alanine ligase [Planctomycetia bacterium]|nr:pantoate--beta-alanine ligase [Planctomycetia bacterium]